MVISKLKFNYTNSLHYKYQIIMIYFICCETNKKTNPKLYPVEFNICA